MKTVILGMVLLTINVHAQGRNSKWVSSTPCKDYVEMSLGYRQHYLGNRVTKDDADHFRELKVQCEQDMTRKSGNKSESRKLISGTDTLEYYIGNIFECESLEELKSIGYVAVDKTGRQDKKEFKRLEDTCEKSQARIGHQMAGAVQKQLDALQRYGLTPSSKPMVVANTIECNQLVEFIVTPYNPADSTFRRINLYTLETSCMRSARPKTKVMTLKEVTGACNSWDAYSAQEGKVVPIWYVGLYGWMALCFRERDFMSFSYTCEQLERFAGPDYAYIVMGGAIVKALQETAARCGIEYDGSLHGGTDE